MSVLHKNLSGEDLHEPKGIETAASGDVYIADGAGSGSWEPVTNDILGLNEYSLTESITDISAANGRVYFRAPIKSEMIGLSVVLDGAIATSDDILTIYVDNILFADSLTVPFAASGAGVASNVAIATTNTVNEGSLIEVRTNGASDNSVRAFVQLRLRAKE